MIISNIPGLSSMSAVKAKVEIYDLDNSLVTTCTCGDFLQSYQISREPETDKFFGFGICQKLDLNLIDLERQLTNLSEGQTVEIYLGDGTTWDKPYPTFYIDTLDIDEKNNTIKAVCYDALYSANEIKVSDITLPASYTVGDVIYRTSMKLGLNGVVYRNTSILPYDIKFPSGANLDTESKETGRALLNYASELAYSIYFINYENKLVFKGITNFDTPDITITNNDYFELTTSTLKSLANIGSATELGENLSTESDFEGVTQYFRENPFLTAPEILYQNEAIDTAGLISVIAGALGAKASATGYVDLTQFYCDWGGNYLLEPGDRLALTGNDGTNKYAILLNDSVTYDGALGEITEWTFTDNKTETFSNPISIGEKINQTFARVDKVNKRVDVVVSDVTETKENVASLTMTTNAINLLVTEHEKKIEAFEELETGQIVDRMAQIEIDLDGIETTVSSHTTQIQANTDEVASVKQTTTTNATKISAIETNLDSINLSVSNQNSKITTLENTVKEDIGELETTTETHTEQISALRVRADEISATVSSVSEVLTSSTENIEQQIDSLTKEVSAKMSAEDVTITVRSELENGVDHVTTQTGFTFNETGLTVEKAGKEMKTQITEDGMTVYRDTTPVLTANNAGVDATNLRASTYIIIGNNSRFENFGNSRTACFWIGGAE